MNDPWVLVFVALLAAIPPTITAVAALIVALRHARFCDARYEEWYSQRESSQKNTSNSPSK
jgi:hypothetical protein